MKRFHIIILLLFVHFSIFSQVRIRYGLTAGLNISTAILPELKINDINSILKGEDVVQGQPQLADYIAMYKGGIFVRLDGGVGSIKLNVNYDKTNIHRSLDLTLFNIEALDIVLSYIDVEMTANLNIFKHFYISAGYIPAYLIEHKGNLNINEFDPRLLSGFGLRIGDGVTVDFNAIIGISEVIDGSYIHNVIFPVTLNIPLK